MSGLRRSRTSTPTAAGLTRVAPRTATSARGSVVAQVHHTSSTRAPVVLPSRRSGATQTTAAYSHLQLVSAAAPIGAAGADKFEDGLLGLGPVIRVHLARLHARWFAWHLR